MYDEGYTKVVEIITGGPAFKSKKLNVNDRIVAVAQGEDEEFVDVIGWRITDVVQLIRGPKETVVRLQIIPAESRLDSKPEVISLVRDKVKLEEQAAKSEVKEITNAGLTYRIGVITIPKFYTDFEGQRNGENGSKSTVTDVKKLLEDLKSENVDGIVIDLRNNGGGSLTEAIDVTGLFIKKGPVVQVKNMDSSIEVGEDPDPSIVYDGPLAVLVNRFSASASEIFAGAIQDYERGIVIGESTYGKGTVQNLIDLNRLASSNANQFGQVKLTIAKYYRINGGSTQELGVEPDIELPSYFDPEEYGEASEPNALPWDQIGSTKYTIINDFSKLIPELQRLSGERRKDNPEFRFIEEDIAEYKESKEDKFVSLNESIRKMEKKLDEEMEFQRENERRKIKGLELLEKGETPQEEEEVKEDNDPFLDETEMIVADMIRISEGLTHLPKN
jgi:carboxyl-terminal processing protease